MTTAKDHCRGVRLEQARRLQLENPWREHPNHPWEEWQEKVWTHNTLLGYWDWVCRNIEME